MTPNRWTFFGWIVGLVLCHQTGTAWAACGHLAASPPTVTVTSDFADPVYDFDRSQAELSGRSGLAGYRLTGLTEVEKTSRLSVAIRYQQAPSGGGVCYALNVIEVTVSARPVRVYVAADYPKGSCLFDVTLRHEHQHVAIERTALAQLAANLKRRLSTNDAGRWHAAETADAAIQTAHKRIEALVTAMNEQSTASVTARHGKLDSPANYRRERNHCPIGKAPAD